MKIIFVGGGSGGHVYPAIAIADYLKKDTKRNWEIIFVGSKSGLEKKILEKSPYKSKYISVGRFHKSVGILERLKTLFIMPVSFLQSISILLKEKPDRVVGMGGFVSGPFVLIACLLRFKVFIWEPNAYPGLANRWVSKFVNEAWVVFDEAKKILNCKNTIRVGMPVREDIQNLPTQKNTDMNKKKRLNIFIFGGSQGSRALNSVIINCIEKEKKWLDQVDIFHQIGSTDFSKIKSSSVFNKNTNVTMVEYIDDMNKYWNWADIVICRAGVGSVAEAWITNTPAIFVPLAAADDHQLKNAQAMESAGGAKIILQRNFNHQSLSATIEEFLESSDQIDKMSTCLKDNPFPRSLNIIYERLI